mmetsp:Transcript_3590/g.5335  ORF Transcript_3590/g.5335 Transcript_3590/m.5335 type:complete len:240 (+) Transcript_3590:97-816(+)
MRVEEAKNDSSMKIIKEISKEVEEVKQRSGEAAHYPFPEASLRFLRSIPGNSTCVDCGANDPQWASISYGVLVCLKCSGRHRSFGVSHSIVRSLQLDTWENGVLQMLEGGNVQWNKFLSRHGMGSEKSSRDRVYFTKAALFYRENLRRHVDKVVKAGVYQGRHMWRQRPHPQPSQTTAKKRTSITESEDGYFSSGTSSCSSCNMHNTNNDGEEDNITASVPERISTSIMTCATALHSTS